MHENDKYAHARVSVYICAYAFPKQKIGLCRFLHPLIIINRAARHKYLFTVMHDANIRVPNKQAKNQNNRIYTGQTHLSNSDICEFVGCDER